MSAETVVPKKTTPNPFALHGPQGRLIVRLQRYGLMGWLMFVLLLVAVLGLVFVSTLAPKPVVAVDASGRVLGTMEYMTGSARTDQEIVGAAMYAAQNCLSLNAEHIADEVAECMNMMDEPLYNHWLELIKNGYVSRIRNAGAHSSVQFDKDGVQILAKKGLESVVQLKGFISVQAEGSSEAQKKPFALELVLTAIPRSRISTRGFRLDSYKDVN